MNIRVPLFCTVALLIGIGLARADFLPNNFWPNAAFENGSNLDQTNGTPAGWNQGGSDPTICQVTTNASVSPTHALMLSDSDTGNYGEWYSDLNLAGLANPGDALTCSIMRCTASPVPRCVCRCCFSIPATTLFSKTTLPPPARALAGKGPLSGRGSPGETSRWWFPLAP